MHNARNEAAHVYNEETADRLEAGIREQIHNVIGTDSSLDRIVLFGSRAKGTFREGSDIDLAVYGPGLSGADASRWIDELEERLFAWSVDIVVVHEETDQELRDQIARVGVEI
jgi:predicted nucleotidyltransferase